MKKRIRNRSRQQGYGAEFGNKDAEQGKRKRLGTGARN